MNPVDRQAERGLPVFGAPGGGKDIPGGEDARGTASTVNVAIGDLPAGKSISIFFDAVVVIPFPNGISQVSQQGSVSGGNFPSFPTDDPDDPTSSTDPTATPVLAAPNLAGATKSVSDAVTGNNDGQAQPGETLQYAITVANSGNGGDSSVNITDTVPAGTTLVLGSIGAVLSGGASGLVDNSAGNTLDVTVSSMPGAGSQAVVNFQVVVDATVAAGLEVLSNTGQVESPKTPLFDTTQADIPLDAVPEFTLDKDDGGVNVDPGSSVVYTLTYTNIGDQDASNVMLEETVPVGGLFDAGASTAGWSCADGDPEGTPCTFSLGTVASGDSAAVDFAVEVVPPQDAPPTIDNTATVIDDGAGSGGVPVAASDSDSTPVNDLLPPTIANVDTLKGNGDGTLEECENVANRVSAFRVEFSEGMAAASVTDVANWQVVGAGPDLDLSTTVCGAPLDDDVAVAIDGVSYDALSATALVDLDVSPFLEDAPYRLMACSGAGGLTDAVGNELDGDGDFSGGDDFVRYFRIDLIDAFAGGHFDCELGEWVPMENGSSTVVHDPLMDIDGAGISGSTHFSNSAGNTELALGQCVKVGGGAVHDFNGFVFLDTPFTALQVIRSCEFFTASDCSGDSLPTQAFFDTISTTGVWTGFDGLVSVPLTAGSALCQATLRNGVGTVYEAFLDDLSLDLLQSPIIFQDGFESGNTSAWSTTVP